MKVQSHRNMKEVSQPHFNYFSLRVFSFFHYYGQSTLKRGNDSDLCGVFADYLLFLWKDPLHKPVVMRRSKQ